MDKVAFLLELGCEEIPEKQLEIAKDSITNSFKDFAHKARLNYSSLKVACTPRRMAIKVDALDARQADLEIIRSGPAVSIAYTKEGELSPAGAGFIKKNNATAADCFIQKTDKGEFLGVKFMQAGKDSSLLLQEWIPGLIQNIPFGKKMIWSDKALAFSRPLRWILALFDGQILPLEFFGLMSANLSYGNRYLGLDYEVPISNPDSYFSALLEAKVMADPELRKRTISEQLENVLHGTAFRVVDDPRLVDTVCNLVEYPHAVVGEFEPGYLKLPEKIIISTISQNQKYFSVRDGQGLLANKFVFISNGDPGAAEIIRKGNEKVVNARLADAMWYYAEDTKHPLEWYVPRLQEVVFQSQLGTMAQKAKRVEMLAESICKELNLDAEHTAKVLRCASLCKADLVTTMLGEKEFTKLQGYIGMQYAYASGEDPEIARGIYEHYLPRGSADDLPETLCGSIVAVADKLDTVAGIIAIGMLPTGSGDPFALRRAANGIVQIISSKKWDIDLYKLADEALEAIARDSEVQAEARTNIHGFLDLRVTGLLSQQGISYDVIDSVMHIDKSHLTALENRAATIQELKAHPDFIKLVIGFKRVANIIAGDKEFAEFDPARMVEAEEKALFTGLSELRDKIEAALQEGSYRQSLDYLIAFGSIIDSFFDAVLVNCDDKDLQANRHALLSLIRSEFIRVADLSLIVLDGE
ncbi:MAG: glycine--tRNA ligase subunit beta [Candidatus Cloacimonetes bacterium]|nr:glycine--tRNA ligase subunit beta [Candidatus Cloacimonadota bacterium]